MGNKIERFQDFEAGNHRYLFFGNELHVGTGKEGHESILQGSTRSPGEITVAGGLFRQDDLFIVSGEGSMSLCIKDRNATPVIDYIKSLPDSAGKTIIRPEDV